jgi:class 3 adenylate cyclase
MKQFFWCFLLLLPIFSFAKSDLERLDSTYQYIVKHPEDKEALHDLNHALNYLFYDYYDTCYFYAVEQVKYAQRIQDEEIITRGVNMMGMCIEFQGYLDSAVGIYMKASALANEYDLPMSKIDIYNNLSIVYSFKGEYSNSIEFAFKALDMAERINDSLRMMVQYGNIGLRYSELGNSVLAIENYKLSLAIRAAMNSERSTAAFINSALEYAKLNNIDSAFVYFHKALIHAKETNRSDKVAAAYRGYASLYIRMNNIPLARIYADSLWQIANMYDDDMYRTDHDGLLAYIFMAEDEHAKAKQLLLKVNRWYERFGYRAEQVDVMKNLASVYNSLGELDSAYYFLERFTKAKDSVFTQQRDQAALQLRAYREGKMQREIELGEVEAAYQKELKNNFIIIGVLLFLIIIGIAYRFHFVNKTRKALAEKNVIIQKEKERSEELLLNILPSEVAEELKARGESEAKDFDNVTVLFSDFKGFTQASEKLSAKALVKELNACFKAFDEIMGKYQIEKIKTIGDAYMAAGGLHSPRTSEAHDVVLAGLEMQAYMEKRKKEHELKGKPAFSMRVGIHTGPVVAGIVGVKKFQYDIWGDTVNTASRMESHGVVGKVNLSYTTYELIKHQSEFAFKKREAIEVKGKGEMEMWLVSSNTKNQ